MRRHPDTRSAYATSPPGPARRRLTLLQRLALASCAAGLALVAACSGSSPSGGSENPLPPETTEFRAETSVKLEFTATGNGAAPLRFALASAPEGMLIDEAQGRIEWVPQAEQLGEHGVSVTVTDAAGAAVTKSYRVTVAAPAGMPAWIVLATDVTGATPGQPVRVSWRIGGEMPANAVLQLRAHAPQVDAAAADPGQMSWWLDAQGAWSTTEVRREAAAREGEVRVTMPHAMTGLWNVELALLDESGTAVVQAARRVFVADAPALRLVLNRPIANPLDAVKAQLDVAAPAAAGTVRLVAWLVQPDGSVLGLPGMTPGDLEVQRDDPIGTGRHTLLDREFGADEAGEYRIHARLYAAVGGRLLAEASRRFAVCDAPSTASGVVRLPDRTRLDGSKAFGATVQALDLDDRGVTASAAIAADGRYELTLAPGRYVLLSRVLDAASRRYTAESALLEVGCTPAARARDLDLVLR